MTFDEAVTHAQVATSLGCHTDDQHCMRVLGNEAQRLRSLFGNFQLECCDDWTCAEEHARKGAVALHEARAENAELREQLREAKAFGEGLSQYIKSLSGDVLELDWFRRREPSVRAVVSAADHSMLEPAFALDEWLLDNPKPGAGT